MRKRLDAAGEKRRWGNAGEIATCQIDNDDIAKKEENIRLILCHIYLLSPLLDICKVVLLMKYVLQHPVTTYLRITPKIKTGENRNLCR